MTSEFLVFPELDPNTQRVLSEIYSLLARRGQQVMVSYGESKSPFAREELVSRDRREDKISSERPFSHPSITFHDGRGG